MEVPIFCWPTQGGLTAAWLGDSIVLDHTRLLELPTLLARILFTYSLAKVIFALTIGSSCNELERPKLVALFAHMNDLNEITNSVGT